MSTEDFQNTMWSNFWTNFEQGMVFRHASVLEMVSGGKLLDLGCGDGFLMKLLRSKGIDVEGLDISEEAVKKCQNAGFKARVFDFSNVPLPFDADSFNYVVMLDVLEHLYVPESLLEEAKRISKKYIILSVPNFNSLPARLQVLLGRTPENNKPKMGHVYWFNYQVLNSMFAKHNLAIVEMRTNYFWAKAPILGDVIKFLTKLMPNIFALSFVVKLEKKK